MPPRRLDPQRLLAAVTAQREALGAGPYTGPATAEALGAACLDGVIAAADATLAPEREALRGAVIHTLALLEARAPGRAVEVRIPPFAAVQCVAGQRHTRGTPPNVVETDAVTWVRLAAGRTGWPEELASGSVQASGQRADLSHYLPLLAPRPVTGLSATAPRLDPVGQTPDRPGTARRSCEGGGSLVPGSANTCLDLAGDHA